MRLRIQTLPPLPGLKAWFIPAAHQGLLSAIADFKAVLASSVAVLRDAGIRREDIQLLLDDFELLDESRFDEALRDGDLVVIKPRLPQVKIEVKEEQQLSKKRKRHSENGRSQAKRRKHANKSEESSDSDSDSSSSTSSSSSSSSTSSSSSSSPSSTSSSSEESDSSDEPTSSLSSAPSVQRSKPSLQSLLPKAASRRNQHAAVTESQLPAFFVPPGQGKSTTHARNLRRKRLRAAQSETRAVVALEATSSSMLPPQGLSDINAMPLGSRTLPQPSKSKGEEKHAHLMRDDELETRPEVEVEDRREVMMASFGNKNKKKGYKQFLKGPVPKKIVFGGEEAPGQPSQISVEAGSSSQPAPALTFASRSQVQEQRQLPSLIPPSEIQERGELPPNMFVTSVDVEADLWNSKKKNKKKATNTAQHLPEYTYANEDLEEDVDVTLSYGNGDIETGSEAMNQSQLTSPQKISDFDWDQAEQRFDNATKVTRLDQLKQARIVGWKNLELNPQTFTPEILLIASKVLEVSDLTVKVQRLLRSVKPDSGFSGFLAPVELGGEGEGEVEKYMWTEIESLEWRVLYEI